jgi:hypothetical protein
MKHIIMKHVEFEGYAGTNLKDAVVEAFDWFYSSENTNCESVTIRHLNGVKVTFEREDGV